MRAYYRKDPGQALQNWRRSYGGPKGLLQLSGFSRCREASLMHEKLQGRGFRSDLGILVTALKACCSSSNLYRLHAAAIISRNDMNIFVANTLVYMYCKCRHELDAYQIFSRMPHQDVVSWNTVIFGYAENGECEFALKLFEYMQIEGFTPSSRTYVAALKSCASSSAMEEGQEVNGRLLKMKCLKKGMSIHSEIEKNGHQQDIFVANTLVDMYAKCGNMERARRVFDSILHHTVVSWNALIFGYAEGGESELALGIFKQMQDGCVAPNALTYVAVLKAYAGCAEKEDGKELGGKFVKINCLEKVISIHSQLASSRHELDIFAATALIDLYAKCGSMVHACRLFDRIPHENLASWNTLIFAYAECGECEFALQLFSRMQDEGFAPDARAYVAVLKGCDNFVTKEGSKQVQGKLIKIDGLEKCLAIHSQLLKSGNHLDVYVVSALVDLYANCGSMVHARWVFDKAPRHDLASWNALIFGHAESGECEVALQLFTHIQNEGFTPNARTYVAALKACGSLGSLESGKQLHVRICDAGLQNNAVVANCLVGFYGKCGSMVDAQNVFASMKKRDLVAWNALLAGWAHQGDAKQVFDLFERMQEECVQADGITFLSILAVCSHAGLVSKGKEYFDEMQLQHMISPSLEHYACMIDLLGRSNRLDEALALTKNIPFPATSAIWRTLLGACCKWKNVKVGRIAFESLLRLDDKDPSAYALMVNIYATAGMHEETMKIETMSRNLGAWEKQRQCCADHLGTGHNLGLETDGT